MQWSAVALMIMRIKCNKIANDSGSYDEMMMVTVIGKMNIMITLIYPPRDIHVDVFIHAVCYTCT